MSLVNQSSANVHCCFDAWQPALKFAESIQDCSATIKKSRAGADIDAAVNGPAERAVSISTGPGD